MDHLEVLQAAGTEVLRTLRDAGFEAYWVGGCVRDKLLGLPIKDIDIATSAKPADFTGIFDHVKLVGASFGVCLVVIHGQPFEVATYRKDGEYVDLRRPSEVSFGTIEEDATRRDFTVNALYYDPLTDQVIDHVGGIDDLEKKQLRTVGVPGERFQEDALRLLRAIRFVARLNFQLEQNTFKAICQYSSLVDHVAPERVRDELTRILVDSNASRAFRLLDEVGILSRILPEIVAMKGVEQGRRFHPEGDVFVHTLLALDKLENRNPISAWGILLHDVGKPPTFERRDGKITFYQHEHIGADMARDICKRLKFPNAEAAQISSIVKRHMKFMHASEWKNSTMRRFIAEPTIEDDLAVHRADCLASHGILGAYDLVQSRYEEYRTGAEEQASLPEPLLSGNDLIAMGYRPGPRFSEILDRIMDEQLNGEFATSEDAKHRVLDLFPLDEE